MSSKKLYFLLIGVIGLLFFGLIGGAYKVNSLLAAQANQLVILKAKSAGLDQQKISLAQAKKDVIKYTELEKITKTIVPEDKSQAEAVREIVNIAASHNIPLASITFPTSTLGGTAVASPSVGASTAPATAPTANKNTKSLSQLVQVKGIPGVYQLTISVNGDQNQSVYYTDFIGFLTDLEHNRRTAQVSTISLQPDATNRNKLLFNLTLNEYIKP